MRSISRVAVAFVVMVAIAVANARGDVAAIQRRLVRFMPRRDHAVETNLVEAQELANYVTTAGFRDAGATSLRVFYPRRYTDAFVAESGKQRVVLRAIGGHASIAQRSKGTLFYENAYDSVDAVQRPENDRSEEILVLRDANAPAVYDYEVVEMSGVENVAIENGAIRFVSAAPSVTPAFIEPHAGLQIEKPWVIDANGTRSDSAVTWSFLDDSKRRLRLTVRSDGLTFPLLVDPSFTQTVISILPVEGHTVTLLQNGDILIAGGYNRQGAYYSDQLLTLDSSNLSVDYPPKMTVRREYHTATLLADGRVLLVGGYTGTVCSATADIYDPVTSTTTRTIGDLALGRYGHTATLLANGKVLIAGGTIDSIGNVTGTCELFDPGTGKFTPAGTMNGVRHVHAATLLPNGKVLITGGFVFGFTAGSQSADLYDPAGTGTFTPVAGFFPGRYYHSSTLLDDGRVLIAGGYSAGNEMTSTLLFNPTNSSFSIGPDLKIARSRHTATLLPNGKVLLAGGASTNTAELFDPSNDSTALTATLDSIRFLHSAVLLPGGTVLLLGGNSDATTNVPTELLYDLGDSTVTSTGSMGHGRTRHTSTLLPNGRVLIAGGTEDGTNAVASAELFNPGNPGSFAPAANMQQARLGHTATLLQSGKVLIAGGRSSLSSGGIASAEIYDPDTDQFESTGTMNAARARHTATLLANGNVLIAGGAADGKSAETYDPLTRKFNVSGSMAVARAGHAAVLLPNGRVFISGGSSSVATELYRPDTDTFLTALDDLKASRTNHAATLLRSGSVLVSGGDAPAASHTAELYNGSGFGTELLNISASRSGHQAMLLPTAKPLLLGGGPATSEQYDNATNVSAASATLSYGSGFTATALPDGRVLIAGGLNPTPVATASLFDPGPRFKNTRPVVTNSVSPICQPAALVLNGSGFVQSEGSSGNSLTSDANGPMLRLQRLGNEQLQFVPLQSFSPTTLNAAIANMTTGFYRLAIVSNAVPSFEQLVRISSAPAPSVGTYSDQSLVQAMTVAVTPSAPLVFGGTDIDLTLTTTPGFTGGVSIDRQGVVTIKNAGPVGGPYTVTLSASTGCGSVTRSFSFTVTAIGTPVINAQAISAAQVNITWPPVKGAASYVVFRSFNGSSFTNIGSTNTESYSDMGLNANTTYLYQVEAIDNAMVGSPLSATDLATTIIFTDDPLQVGVTKFKGLHITEARTAVNAVRLAAGKTAFTFTDPSPTNQPLKATYIQELRTALNEALTAIFGAPITFTYPASPNTPARAADLTEIRNAVK